VRFRPLEDVLGCGHTNGVSSIVVPGAGEPNFDSFENNPFINNKQRREQEVQGLLNKLSHEMIGLDASFVGQVDKDQTVVRAEHQQIFHAANQTADDGNKVRSAGYLLFVIRLRALLVNLFLTIPLPLSLPPTTNTQLLLGEEPQERPKQDIGQAAQKTEKCR
jgi:hypothetical protein